MSDEELALVAPYLTLMREDASRQEYELREVFNGAMRDKDGCNMADGAA